jgi:type I restriction enzyme R subunit
MTSQTNELALESAIEKALCGATSEDSKKGAVAEPQVTYGGKGYRVSFRF